MSGNKNSPDMVLSVRGAKLARDVGATTVGELARFTDMELLSAKCFGETSLREIREKLEERGFRLGMTLQEVRSRAGTEARIVTSNQKNPNHPAHEEHEGPCCGDCAAAARQLRERSAARKSESSEGLVIERRREVFEALVGLQDRGSLSVFGSLSHIARQYRLGIAQVRQIEDEGIDKQWPPLGQPAPDRSDLRR